MAAEGHGDPQERAAERRAEARRTDGPAPLRRDENTTGGQRERADREPERGDFEHAIPLPKLNQFRGRQHLDLGVRDRDAMGERHVVADELTFDAFADRREVERHRPRRAPTGAVRGPGARVLLAHRPQHRVVCRPVRRVPRRAERLGLGEGARRVVREVLDRTPQRGPHPDLAQDPGGDRVRERLPYVRVGGQRRHDRLVARPVRYLVRRPRRQRAHRREQAGEHGQRGRQGAAGTVGHPSRQDLRPPPRERSRPT